MLREGRIGKRSGDAVEGDGAQRQPVGTIQKISMGIEGT